MNTELQDYVQELKNRTDIMVLAGQMGLAPDDHGKTMCFNGHDKKTPSLQFYEDSQRYHCFGCQATGDVISLVQQIEGCSFLEAVNRLAADAGMEPWQNTNGANPEFYGKVKACLDTAARMYHRWLEPDDSYLRERGIERSTAQQHMLGRTRGRNDLCEALMKEGFDAFTLLQSGLIKETGDDFFQNHVIAPIMNYGTVVDFYGRALNGDGKRRHWRLNNQRLKVGEGLFNWNPRLEEIILVEGIFDALSLVQHGFPQAVALLGTQGLIDHYLQRIRRSRVKRIFVCYDGDDGARASAMRDAFAMEDIGKSVRIIDLPGGKDPNEFFMKYGADDFKELVAAAYSPFDRAVAEIKSISDRDEQLLRVTQELVPRIMKTQPISQHDLIKRISRDFDIPIKNLNEQIKQTDMIVDTVTARAEPKEVVNLKAVRPALDLVDGTMILSAPRQVVELGNQAPQWENTVITSKRERFPLCAEDLANQGWFAKDLDKIDIRVAEERYSRHVIEGFLQGKLSGDLAEAFHGIKDTVGLYLDFTDARTYDYLTCWIIGTYFYNIFSHYPYVHFTGPKGTGKSQCLHVLERLCHNAKMAGSMSLAVQFRLIEALQPTILFDEMENLGQTQHTELHRMLKYGFEKNGPQVWRMDTTDKKPDMRAWSVYCPRAFASIEGMEDVIGSRSVQIIMERSFDDTIKSRTVQSDEPIWQDLRDQLFLVALAEGARVKSIYDELAKPAEIDFAGRDWDIYKGVYTVALAMADPAVTHQVIRFAVDVHENKVALDNENSPDTIILQFLSETVTDNRYYELGELNSALTEMASTQGLDLQGRMTRDRLGKRLNGLRVFQERKREMRNGKKVTVYRMDPKVIQEKLDNHLRG